MSDTAAIAEVEFKINGVCSTSDAEGRVGYFTLKSSAQTKEKVNLNSQICENTTVECRVRTVDTVATVDEENIYIDIIYAIDTDAFCAGCEESLSEISAKEGTQISPRGSKITVYYPKSEDSLFSVARAYHTSVGDIARANMLTESVMNSFAEPGSLSGIKKLIIK